MIGKDGMAALDYNFTYFSNLTILSYDLLWVDLELKTPLLMSPNAVICISMQLGVSNNVTTIKILNCTLLWHNFVGAFNYLVMNHCHCARWQTFISPIEDQQKGSLWTHWGRDKMDAISQTTVLDAFSWMKMYELRLKFDWTLFLRVQWTIFQHCLRLWLGAIQTTSHYLNQWWLVYRRI